MHSLASDRVWRRLRQVHTSAKVRLRVSQAPTTGWAAFLSRLSAPIDAGVE